MKIILTFLKMDKQTALPFCSSTILYSAFTEKDSRPFGFLVFL